MTINLIKKNRAQHVTSREVHSGSNVLQDAQVINNAAEAETNAASEQPISEAEKAASTPVPTDIPEEVKIVRNDEGEFVHLTHELDLALTDEVMNIIEKYKALVTELFNGKSELRQFEVGETKNVRVIDARITSDGIKGIYSLGERFMSVNTSLSITAIINKEGVEL